MFRSPILATSEVFSDVYPIRSIRQIPRASDRARHIYLSGIPSVSAKCQIPQASAGFRLPLHIYVWDLVDKCPAACGWAGRAPKSPIQILARSADPIASDSIFSIRLIPSASVWVRQIYMCGFCTHMPRGARKGTGARTPRVEF